MHPKFRAFPGAYPFRPHIPKQSVREEAELVWLAADTDSDYLGAEAMPGQCHAVGAVRQVAIKCTPRGRAQHSHCAAIERLELGRNFRQRDEHLITHIPEDSHEDFLCRRYFLGKMQRIE